ncbi:MAG: hypothetical protein ACKV2Q_36420 [Planctomycetaceae bacterium]
MNPKPRQWTTWRVRTTDDTSIVVFTQAGLAAALALADGANKLRGVYPFSTVVIRVFGKNAASLTGWLQITGWGDNQKGKGRGPGTLLWRGEVTTGSLVFDQAPLDDGKWTSAGNWYAVNNFNSGGGTNFCAATELSDADQAELYIPTLLLPNLMLEMKPNNGHATPMTEMGVMFRCVGDNGID